MSTLSPDQWQALSPYLDEALEMTDVERTTWLSALRTQSPDLADQLEVLFREHRTLSEEGFLEKACIGMPKTPGRVGQRLGVYTLLSQIGQGGMGDGHAYLALARALQSQGKLDAARAAFRSASEHLQSALGPDHPDTRSARQMAESETLRK